MGAYLLAHDLGTSGCKAVLYDTEGNLKASALYEYKVSYPKEGWVEQDPEDWWGAVCGATKELLERSGIQPSEILALSFSAQMMGCLLVDREGNPLHPMLIWADTRSGEQEKRMIQALGARRGYEITGHRLSASYSAAKLLWLKDHRPEVYQKGFKLLHVKDYIVCKLTGVFATDYSDASGTNLLDINQKTWSEELIRAFEIRRELLPELHASSTVIGTVTPQAATATGLPAGLPVVLGGGDGSCACVGAGVVKGGMAYNVIGTSSWISCAAERPYLDPDMRTFNWIHLDPQLYTPCGTMQAAGFSYAWFRDTFGDSERAVAARMGTSAYQLLNAEIERCQPGAGGVLYLPYLLGERSPRWNHKARGAFVGMGASTTKGDMARAVLEGVGFNLKVILDALEQRDAVDELVVIGGGAKGDTWLQILADIWQKPLAVPVFLEEATSLGAIICAGVGAGVFSDYSAIERFNPIQKRIAPNPEHAGTYDTLFRIFEETYQSLLPVYERLAARGEG